MRNAIIVRDKDGAFFVFWDRRTYGEPQFSRLRVDAAVLPRSKALYWARVLRSRKTWGEPVTLVPTA